MKTTRLYFGVFFSIAVAAHSGGSWGTEESAGVTAPVGAAATATAHVPGVPPAKAPPLAPYPRLLPLELIAPPTAQAGVPLDGVSVSLLNPGDDAPNARLRLTIHYKDHRDGGGDRDLTSDNVKVEVLEGELWKPVLLEIVEGGVMGAIGTEGVAAHRERHRRGGFALPAGLNKTWQLRLTFDLPGIYSLVSAVSPDNGSRHLAQPAHAIIEVQ